MAKLPDPTEDIYTILDAAGLRAPNLLSAKGSLNRIVLSIREELARQLKEYISIREEAVREERTSG